MFPGIPYRWLAFLLAIATPLLAQEKPKAEPRDFLLPAYEAYFSARVAALHPGEAVEGAPKGWSADVTKDNWPERSAAMRKELQYMLGLDPWPAKGDLQPVITGTVQGDGYRVEKLHFQSSPGLYVSGNLYLPADTSKPLPTILYVCGHALVVEDKVSMGNKTAYQHHGSWFARHGYVCLIIDTIELGEIRGEHHGTFSKGRWWWPGRGYTPTGVEAWNSIRALDYLETRPEVDKTRFGITGRSGGGSYSWFTAALDERIKAAVPTAGITDMQNHIVDGCIEGHCDCMYMLNSAGWDFDQVSSLIAPRALLVANTDKDPIFPLDGVVAVYNRTREVYTKLGQLGRIGLQIAEGGHLDVQPLNTGAFHWMNRFLQGAKPLDLTDEPARKLHKPAELKVFEQLPADEKVTTVDEWFVPAFQPPPPPADKAAWEAQRTGWLQTLRERCFRAWGGAQPQAKLGQSTTEAAGGLRLTTSEVLGGGGFPLMVYTLQRDTLTPAERKLTVLNVLDEAGWAEFLRMRGVLFPVTAKAASAPAPAGGEPAPKQNDFAGEKRMLETQPWVMAFIAPRGVGPTSIANLSEKKQTQIRRRFQLMGETLESGQVWDICQAATALGTDRLWLQGEGTMGVNALYASLFLPKLDRIDLHRMPDTQAQGPIYLEVLRYLDLPQALALAAERTPVIVYTEHPEKWEYARSVAKALEWPEKQLQFREVMKDPCSLPSSVRASTAQVWNTLANA